MKTENAAVAVLDTHADAEHAVEELQRSGFNMKKLSIVGKDFHTEEHVVGYYNAGDRMQFWGKLGAFWGGLWGILIGSAYFLIPGIGPLVIAGPLVSAIVGGLEGAVVVGGLSALGAGLYSLGIPKDSILQYETAIKSERFVLVMHGTTDELNRAKETLKGVGYETDVHTQLEPAHISLE
ncbi:MAG TPA: general stress protein [Planctomycetota bacterium]|nr:general stress protein [Planctomycetota bacterium]